MPPTGDVHAQIKAGAPNYYGTTYCGILGPGAVGGELPTPPEPCLGPGHQGLGLPGCLGPGI